jgi:protein involved in polysaccharide export with SLBB domain
LLQPGQWNKFAVTIDAEGRLRIPHIGEITAAGRTVSNLEETIAATLKQGSLMTNPQVDVSAEYVPAGAVALER